MPTITLLGAPKSTNHIYKYACRGSFPCMYMTADGKALKEDYQWQAKGQFHGEPLSGPLSVAIDLYFPIRDAGLLNETYDYPYWLKKVREANFDHPEEEIKRLLKKLDDLAAWMLKEKGQVMTAKGGWLTNRLKEQAKGPQPRN